LKRSEGFFEEIEKFMKFKYSKHTIKKTRTQQSTTWVRAINNLQFKPPINGKAKGIFIWNLKILW